MKINRKALKLIDKGLSSKTVSKLTESQIDTLYSRMISEQTMVSKTDTATINKLKTDKKPFQVYEKELEEDDDFDLDADQTYTGQQGSHDEYQAADDGMDDDTSPENHDSKMIGMSEEKDNQPNPWEICHAQVGPKKTRMCNVGKKTIGRRKKSRIFVFRNSNRKNRGKTHTPKNYKK